MSTSRRIWQQGERERRRPTLICITVWFIVNDFYHRCVRQTHRQSLWQKGFRV